MSPIAETSRSPSDAQLKPQTAPDISSIIGIADLDAFLREPASDEAQEQCRRVAESIITTGAVIIRDTRASESANSSFLTMLEDYFAQPLSVLASDERPELGYQVGVTLPNTEKPSCKSNERCTDIIAKLAETERPLDILGHDSDPKSRFFWRMTSGDTKPKVEGDVGDVALEAGAEKARKGDFAILQAPNVVPAAFREVWDTKMDDWGCKMRDAVHGVAEMLAVGLNLERDVFTKAAVDGTHLLAPTATDLNVYGQLNTIFAGFHSDLNFLTIHGKSRYPGLHIWARNTGKKVPVKVPDGCLLVQAGKQLEWLSGGLVKAGYHEVVCTQGTLDAIERMQRDHPDRPCIRISSTFFYHLSSDFDLKPLPPLSQAALKRFGPQEEYGKMKVGDQVKRELGLIALYNE